MYLDAATTQRAGHILLADSTIFTTLFGGVESLETFWKNLATMPLASKVQPRPAGRRLIQSWKASSPGRSKWKS